MMALIYEKEGCFYVFNSFTLSGNKKANPKMLGLFVMLVNEETIGIPL